MRKLYASVQPVYQKAVCTRVHRFVWFTAMHVLGILHLLYEAPRDLPICVPRLCGKPYGKISQHAIQIPSVFVAKCHLHQSFELSLVYCHVYSGNCTPTVWGAKGSPNLVQRLCWQPYGNKSQQAVHMSRAVVLICWQCLLPCAFLKLYTYCTRCQDTAPFCADGLWHLYSTYIREVYRSVHPVYENTAYVRVI